jgi:hypothetical protein
MQHAVDFKRTFSIVSVFMSYFPLVRVSQKKIPLVRGCMNHYDGSFQKKIIDDDKEAGSALSRGRG